MAKRLGDQQASEIGPGRQPGRDRGQLSHTRPFSGAADTFYVGTGTDFPDVLADLGAVQRLAGDDRFATSAAVADHVAARSGDATQTVYVSTGFAYADPLAAGAVVGAEGAPVLLVASDAVPEATGAALVHAAVGSDARGATTWPDRSYRNLPGGTDPTLAHPGLIERPPTNTLAHSGESHLACPDETISGPHA